MPPETPNNQFPKPEGPPPPTPEPQPFNPAPAQPQQPVNPPSQSPQFPQSPRPQFPTDPRPAYGQQNPIQPPRKSGKKRWLLVAIITLLVLLGGSAAAYFGYYVPNQPDQIWKKSLSNSATGLDKLTEYYESQGEAMEKGTLKGNFKFEEKGSVVDGNIETKYDTVNSATKLDAGFMGIRVDAEILTNIPEGAQYPDVYAKVGGLEGLNQILGGEAGAAVNGFNNQWYVVDHTLFDQMMSETPGEDSAPSLSSEDIDEIVRVVSGVNREYIFTDDPNKAVLVRKQDVGREKLNDRDTYHFKVSYNKENLKAYSNALKDALNETKLKDYIPNEDFGALTSAIDGLSGEGEADLWVDMKTKLIRQVRFNNVDNKQGDYIDIALNYNGGDEYPFVITAVSNEEKNKGTSNLGVTLNTNTNEIKFNLDGDGEENGEPLKFNFSATLAPSSEAVEFNKPKDAKSLLEAFGGLMGGSGGLTNPAGFSGQINEL